VNPSPDDLGKLVSSRPASDRATSKSEVCRGLERIDSPRVRRLGSGDFSRGSLFSSDGIQASAGPAAASIRSATALAGAWT
jgi:hypothetical protein